MKGIGKMEYAQVKEHIHFLMVRSMKENGRTGKDTVSENGGLKMVVSNQLFEAYLKCKTKAYRLSSTDSVRFRSVDEIYQWKRQIIDDYSRKYVKSLVSENPNDCLLYNRTTNQLKSVNCRWIVGPEISTDHFFSKLPLLENHSCTAKRSKGSHFIPIRLFPSEKIHKDKKYLLAFDAMLLGKVTGHFPTVGKIIHGREQVVAKVRLTDLIPRVKLIGRELKKMLELGDPPSFSLNRHCNECEFKPQCKDRAVKEDNISLLAVIPPKEIAKLKNKGIFTVTQLSYTFRPRRRKVKTGVNKFEKYQYALKALAIRERTTYVVGTPNFTLDGTIVYLDVEGVPDRKFYYLIGVRVVSGKCKIKKSFWANNKSEEKRIWQEFIELVVSLENPILLHYGSYETTFLKNMQSRYTDTPKNGFDISSLLAGAINILSIIYKHIYFPTYTNGLKDIAKHLGFSWSTDNPSGLYSLLLRHKWELTNDKNLKQELLSYNESDCKALEIVTKAITAFEQNAGCPPSVSSIPNAVQIETIKYASWPYFYNKQEFAFPELAYITKCAYWDYQRDRIYVRTNKRIKRIAKKNIASSLCSIPVNKIINPTRPSKCQKCGSVKFLLNGRHKRTIFDLRFMSGGIKRWVTKNIIDHYKCYICGATFVSDNVPVPRNRFGQQLAAFVIYNIIELHIAQSQVTKIIQKNYGIPISQPTIGYMKQRAAEYYSTTFKEIKNSLLQGKLIHADETNVIVVGGHRSYVWVFTSMEEVVYIWSDTREAKTATDLLVNFSGVLVSDFYTAYDSINCQHQKCLIHLIRDLNDALLKEPFNEEIKTLLRNFGELVKNIIATVDQFGLKKYFLKKHISEVEKFYTVIEANCYTTESAQKFQKRFKKNRGKLFTFLKFDGIPWNNNNAEHAVKVFGRGIRDYVKGRVSKQGIKDYLILLSIYQTCEYRGIDFLEFLRSGETGLDNFPNK